MTVVSLNSYAEARKAGLPWWRLEITNWGNRQTGAAATSLIYPASGSINAPGPWIPGGAACVAIGPDSTVDEMIVDYNQVLTPGTWSTPDAGDLNQTSMTVSYGRPGILLPGPMVYRAAYSSMFGDSYIKDGVTGTADLGTNAVFEAPRLQVLTYFKPPAVPPATKRADMYRSFRTTMDGSAGEKTFAIWPVMGRRSMTVFLTAQGTLVANVRVGAIVDYCATVASALSARPTEETILSGTVNATTAAQLRVASGKPAMFLAVYGTYTSGVGLVNCTMIATDDLATDTPSSL